MSKATILLVDDDTSLLTLLDMRLSSEGYDVKTESSPEKALMAVAAEQPDLVITDLRMDEMDGMELHQRIQQQFPGLPTLMITAHGSIPDAVAATQQGFVGFITKPIDKQELKEAIEKALEQSGFVKQNDKSDWHAPIITRNRALQQVLTQAKRLINTDLSILISGDTGTGKELLARAIHQKGDRASQPFVAVNCAAIPEHLLESELFGYQPNALDIPSNSKGLFASAAGGTLFLDEIAEMPSEVQAKLLSVLKDNIEKAAGQKVRVISATHHDMNEKLREESFREDLYYRLNVVNLRIPPLSERHEDIPLLAKQFCLEYCEEHQLTQKTIAPDAIELLIATPWPGNVRQLKNAVYRAAAVTSGAVISFAQMEQAVGGPSELPSFTEARSNFERDFLVRLLKMTEGNVTKSARLAQRNRTDFYKLLNRHNVDPSQFKPKA
jgi:two-component system response regulator GlrR|tara:strand:+ start:472 stop:1791 length:1320 start_codon:yes stop_codon:yes gene_type:complete